MAPEKVSPLGRPSKEEIDITSKLSEQLESMVQKREEMPGILRKILGLEQQILLTGSEVLTKSGKKLKYDKETAKALIEVNDINADIMDSLSDQFAGLTGIIKQVRGIGAALKIMMLNPFTAILAILGTLVMLGLKFAKRVNEIRRDTGLAAIESAKLAVEMKKAELSAKRYMIDSEQMEAATTALVNRFGQMNSEMIDFSVEFARVTGYAGLQEEQAAEMISLLMTQKGVTRDIALNQIESLAATAQLEGITPAALWGELSNNAELFASSIGKSEKQLIKAIAASKKLGSTMSGLTDFADGLLDVTQRINKEHQLSVIYGRAISLDRVAALHAQGRIDEAQRELATELRGFDTLPGVQQRFVQEIIGSMQVEQLKKLNGLIDDQNNGRTQLLTGTEYYRGINN